MLILTTLILIVNVCMQHVLSKLHMLLLSRNTSDLYHTIGPYRITDSGMYSYIPTLNTSLKTSIHSRIVAAWLKIPT